MICILRIVSSDAPSMFLLTQIRQSLKEAKRILNQFTQSVAGISRVEYDYLNDVATYAVTSLRQIQRRPQGAISPGTVDDLVVDLDEIIETLQSSPFVTWYEQQFTKLLSD